MNKLLPLTVFFFSKKNENEDLFDMKDLGQLAFIYSVNKKPGNQKQKKKKEVVNKLFFKQ